jgi:hypothetical protein
LLIPRPRAAFFFLVEYTYFCSQYVQVTVMLLMGGVALRATHEPYNNNNNNNNNSDNKKSKQTNKDSKVKKTSTQNKVKQNMLANTHAGKIINEHNYTLMSYFSFIARPSAFKKILFITKK